MPTVIPTVDPEEPAADDIPTLVLLEGVVVAVVIGELELDGLRPNGQKSPPLGGSTQVNEEPSLIV